MTDLLLIFLGAAYLENLVLAIGFDVVADPAIKPQHGLFILAGLLLLAAAAEYGFGQGWQLPPRATDYLHALAFTTTIIAIAPANRDGAAGLRIPTRLNRFRLHLPLLVANLAVLAYLLLGLHRSHGRLETAIFCLLLSLGFEAVSISYRSLQQRLKSADIPRPWRGLPITAVSASILSLALMGFSGLLP